MVVVKTATSRFSVNTKERQNMKARMTIAATLAVCAIAVTSNEVSATDCTSPSMRADVSSPTPLSITGENISLTSMQELWRIATTTENPTIIFARVIAQDQDWLGACEFPGIGLATGSGMTARDRNVTLWIWSSGVDFLQARESIYVLVGEIDQPTTTLPPETTTTTTTTTLPPTPVTTTTTTLPPEQTTTTTLPPDELVFTQSYAYARGAVGISAPVKVQSVARVFVKKITAKKKKVVTIKIAPKKRKKK
jgi:hypothetical protein